MLYARRSASSVTQPIALRIVTGDGVSDPLQIGLGLRGENDLHSPRASSSAS